MQLRQVLSDLRKSRDTRSPMALQQELKHRNEVRTHLRGRTFASGRSGRRRRFVSLAGESAVMPERHLKHSFSRATREMIQRVRQYIFEIAIFAIVRFGKYPSERADNRTYCAGPNGLSLVRTECVGTGHFHEQIHALRRGPSPLG